MQPTIIVSHAEDPDGIIAATIVAGAFESDQVPYDIHLVDYLEQSQFFSNLALNKRYIQNSSIIVCDLNTQDSLLKSQNGISDLDHLASHANSLTIFDHHNGTKKHQSFLVEKCGVDVQIGDGTKQCTSTIASQYFQMQSQYFSWLASLAQEHDYPTGNEELMKVAKDLQGIIALYNHSDRRFDLLELAETLQNSAWIKDGNYMPSLQEDLDEYNVRADPAYAELLANKTTIKAGGKKFIVSISDSILPSKDAARHLKYNNIGQADGYCVLFKDPRNSAMFSGDPESEFDAVPFCTFMGGGGRDGNGGFNIKVLANDHPFNNYEKLKRHLDQFYLENPPFNP